MDGQMDSTTFAGDPERKAKLVRQLKRHLRDDAFVRQAYAEASKTNGDYMIQGCALGCTIMDTIPKSRRPATLEDATEITAEINERVIQLADAWFGEEYGEDNWPAAAAQLHQLPTWLTRLEEAIFEGFGDEDDWATWPLRLVEAIPVGLDNDAMASVEDEFIRRVTEDPESDYAAAGNAAGNGWPNWRAAPILAKHLIAVLAEAHNLVPA